MSSNLLHPISIVFFIYIFIIFLIGYIASRVTRNLSDYVLGGRRLSGAVAALGAGASDMSSWLLMALPGTVYLHGINQIWMPIALSVGAYCNWQFVAKRLRIYTEIANDSLTIPAYFDNRFRDTSKILRAVTAIVILIFFTFYAAAGFISGAVLTKLTFNFSYHQALFYSSAIIIIYTCIGGFLAVSWIDFFQGSLMFIALLLMPYVAFNHVGGWHTTLHEISIINSQYLNAYENISVIGLLSLLAWGLGYFGQPHILVRFMAAKSSDEIPIARFICMFWMNLALFGAVFTGLVGIAFFKSAPLQDSETVFIQLATVLFNPWMAGFLMAAVLSAVMSTIAAQLLASASALIEDFYHTFWRKKASNQEYLFVSRVAVVLIACIAIWLAADPKSNILTMVDYAWGGLGASFGPVILLSLYWPRMTRNAAIIGMIVGASTVVVWNLLSEFGGIFQLDALMPGFIFNVITIMAISFAGEAPPLEIQSEFKRVVAISAHP